MKKFALFLLGMLWATLAWGQVSSAPPMLNYKGTSTPSTCTIGRLFFKTDATAGQNLYMCTAANTWTQQLNSGASGNITIGTSTITSGTTTRVLYDNAGVIGEYVISGTGSVCMTTNCAMTTPNLGTPSALVLTNATGTPTSIALTNATVIPTAFCVAASDETTALTTGTAKVTFRMPYAMTLTAVRGSLTTAATGATLFQFDVNEGGTTIFSTEPTFDASEKTTTTAATPSVLSDTALADDAQMTVDIVAVGSTIAGAGLKVCLIGTKN